MSARTFLVVVDESPEFPVALYYAAKRALAIHGHVALLSVVEPQGIETWGGVERALDDEAFDRAREISAVHEKTVQSIMGCRPKAYFRKGEVCNVLLDLIDQEKEIATLVLAVQTSEGPRNPLIQYLTSEKGVRKLKIPLIIVPDTCRCLHEEG
ncbi:MAG: universal stress protein [Alphaproteobacteria bacterium]|nr:universal stress protein [Alphaproteobacteria bacterium]